MQERLPIGSPMHELAGLAGPCLSCSLSGARERESSHQECQLNELEMPSAEVVSCPNEGKTERRVDTNEEPEAERCHESPAQDINSKSHGTSAQGRPRHTLEMLSYIETIQGSLHVPQNAPSVFPSPIDRLLELPA